MREIFKIIKEHFILLLGTGLFTYGLFSFNSEYYEGITGPIREVLNPSSPITTYPIAAIYYYYDSTSLILLTIGAILIVFGLLKIRKKKGGN